MEAKADESDALGFLKYQAVGYFDNRDFLSVDMATFVLRKDRQYVHNYSSVFGFLKIPSSSELEDADQFY